MAQMRFHLKTNFNWKWWGALILFSCGFLGFLSGVEVSDRPGLPESNVFTKVYYSFGLFILGGMDLGMPGEGPLYGRILLWTAYFGAPILTASAVIESVLHALAPHSLHLTRLKNHIVIIGSGDLAFSFLEKIRENDSKRPVLVVADEENRDRFEDIQSYGRIGIVVSMGDPKFFMQSLRTHRAHRILLLMDDDIKNCEAATRLIEARPELASRIIFHVSDLSFLRMLQQTNISQQCIAFNSYQMAARHIAREMLVKQFNTTVYRDTVVLAGFGRFGQSILEELEQHCGGEFSTVAILDVDAKRNALVSDQEIGREKGYVRHIIEGNIDHPDVWSQLFKEVVIVDESPVFIMSTGNDQRNMGAAIWLRKRYKDALIISLSVNASAFAREVGKEHNIISINTTELMEAAIPREWYMD